MWRCFRPLPALSSHLRILWGNATLPWRLGWAGHTGGSWEAGGPKSPAGSRYRVPRGGVKKSQPQKPDKGPWYTIFSWRTHFPSRIEHRLSSVKWQRITVLKLTLQVSVSLPLVNRPLTSNFCKFQGRGMEGHLPTPAYPWLYASEAIGVGDGDSGQVPSPAKKKSGKVFFGQLLC